MPTKRDVLLNPVVSEYIYDCLMLATNEQKKGLNGKYLRATRTTKSAKFFAVKSTMEEKAILLAKLGIPFSWNFNITKKKMKELFENRTTKPNELNNLLLKEKIVIVTEKEIIQYLGLLASNVHSEMWMLNRDFLKVGHMMTDWRKEFTNVELKNIKDNKSTAKSVARLMSAGLVYAKYSDAIFGLTEVAMSILLFLYSKDKEFVTDHEVRVYFMGIYRNFKLGQGLTALLRTQFIEVGLLGKEREYRVTSFGVDAILRFEKKVFSI